MLTFMVFLKFSTTFL